MNAQVYIHDQSMLDYFRSKRIAIYEMFARDQVINAIRNTDNLSHPTHMINYIKNKILLISVDFGKYRIHINGSISK